MLTSSIPIESSFRAMLVDNLNAELVLGSVTNVKEAASWLGYTYLAVRMRQNPLAYGLTWDELAVRAGGGRKSRRRRWCCCGASDSLQTPNLFRFCSRGRGGVARG